MNPEDQGVRKAAVLLASLDRPAAEAMLEALGPGQARRVRQVMRGLGKIDLGEQQRVIDEFVRVGPRDRKDYPPGIELDDRVARRLAARPAPLSPRRSPNSAPPPGRPFRFLEETEADKLARMLVGERPQTIALVLSHLPAEQAGNVLPRLHPSLQVDVIRRLVDLEETDPEILREVERALESRLSQQVQMQRRRVAGLEAVAGILEASGTQVAGQIINNLAARDPALAERLSPPAIEFDDLAELDEPTLAAIFEAAGPELATTALVGAPPELVDRLLRGVAPPEAKALRHKLDHPGPIRLSDVEAARRQLIELARRLAVEGRIQLAHQEAIATA